MVERKESANVHEALNVLLLDLDDAADLVVQAIALGLEGNTEDILNALRKAELSADIFKAFLKASLNDDKETWTYTIPSS